MTIKTCERVVKGSALMAFLFILMSLLLVQARSQSISDMANKQKAEAMIAVEEEFETHWQQYRWAARGCPMPKGKDIIVRVQSTAEYCNAVPELKTDEKRKARELAKRVFGLAEPK